MLDLMKSQSRRYQLIFFSILLSGIFLRFYRLESRIPFAADQTWNAWTMKDLLVEGKFPIVGMSPLVNTDIIIGPAYFYLLAPFYMLTGMDPIAAGLFAGVIGVVTGLTLWYIASKLFSPNAGLIAIGVWMHSHHIILNDMIAWPVVLLPVVSVGIFYTLYKSINHQDTSLILLAALLGFAFHVHITALFFVPIFIFAAPFIFRQKHALKTYIAAMFAGSIWFLPHVFVLATSDTSAKMSSFLDSSSHGFHLRRVMQLVPDGVLEFQSIIGYSFPFIAALIALTAWIILWIRSKQEKSFHLPYLIGLWFLVPILILSLYRGVISDYFFTSTRPIVVLCIAYLLTTLSEISKISRYLVILLLVLWAGFNSIKWNSYYPNELPKLREKAYNAVKNREENFFNFSSGDSYLYWYYKDYRPIYPE